jgi:hypothetical protein
MFNPHSGAAQHRLIFAALLLLMRVTVCRAQDVSIRLIDIRSGRPFPNQQVTVQYRKSADLAFETKTVTTDNQGVGIFQLPEPAPKKISIVAYGLYPCYDFKPFDTRLLVESGTALHCAKRSQACHCKFSKQINEIKAKPGQVILLARPFTNWEKFLQHIWE